MTSGGGGREEERVDENHPRVEDPLGKVVFLVVSDQLGPDPEIGRILMRAFLGTLSKGKSLPAKLLFLNRGVHLTTEGSEVVDVLRELERSGAEILSCGTCLDYFGKRDRLHAGRVSNMHETVETLTGGFRAVTIG